MIEDTIPKLEAFKSSYAGITSDLDNLLNRIDGFSVSATSSDALVSKSKGLQVIKKQASNYEACIQWSPLFQLPEMRLPLY